jgi:tRNA A37 N6-isopentenylltransferase MiaA
MLFKFINSDAMQVYKGLDHITSSPSSIEKSITPHLLYNYVDIEDKYDVVRYISNVKKNLLIILAI